MPGTGTPKRKQKTRPSQQGCWRSEGPQGRMPHSAGANVFCWREEKRPVAFKAGVWGQDPQDRQFCFDVSEFNDF